MPLFKKVGKVLTNNIGKIRSNLYRDETLERLINDKSLFSTVGNPSSNEIPSDSDHSQVNEYTDFAMALLEELGEEAFTKVVDNVLYIEGNKTTEGMPFLREGALSKAIFAVYAFQSPENEQKLLEQLEEAKVFKTEKEFDNFKDVILRAAMQQVEELQVAVKINEVMLSPEEKQAAYETFRAINSARYNEQNRERKKSQSPSRPSQTRGYITSGRVLEAIAQVKKHYFRFLKAYPNPDTRAANPMPSKADLVNPVIDAIRADIADNLRQIHDLGLREKIEKEVTKVNQLIDRALDNKDLAEVEGLVDQLHLLNDITYHLQQGSDIEIIKELQDDYNHNSKKAYQNVSPTEHWKIRLSVHKVEDSQRKEAYEFLKFFFSDKEWDNKAHLSLKGGTPNGINKIREILNNPEPETAEEFAQLVRSIKDVERTKGFKLFRGSEMKALYKAIDGADTLQAITQNLSNSSELSKMIDNNQILRDSVTESVAFR